MSSVADDNSAIYAGASEELAGPARAFTPVERQDRIDSVDTLRGFALLGILAMNITSFGLPAWDYMVPLTTALPVFNGPHWRANTIAWFLRWILAEGKMRALFSMLFGAGVILLTSRAEARGSGARVADIYLRRNMWLVVFGMLHAYLIWYGDILYSYGLMGLLFLYPMRHLKVKTLLRVTALILVLNNVVNAFYMAHDYATRNKALAARQALSQGKPLTEQQTSDLQAWDDSQQEWRPLQKKLQEDIKAMRGGYLSALRHQSKLTFRAETMYTYFGFPDVLAFMLLGMALCRNGFLTGRLSYRTYAITAVVGLLIAWPLIFAGCWTAWKSGFDQFVSAWSLFVPYDLGRLGGALGNAAIVLLIVKSGALRWLTRRFASVGQMALSNYLLTGLLCQFFFVWGPWKWYSRVEYYRLYYVVAAVWAINLIWSPIWLRYFQFGPAEWLWRSLTYWKKQPMRIRAAALAPV